MKGIRFAAVLAALFLSACGGGGGGGTGGAFSLSAATASFRAAPNGTIPNQAHVSMTLEGTSTRYVAAGFATAPDPGWLHVYMDGYAPNFTVVIVPNTTALAEGVYTTVVSVVTADGDGDILEQKDIEVSYTIDKPVDIENWYGYVEVPPFVLGHSNHTFDVTVPVASGDDDVYAASSDAAWLSTPATTFQGPQDVTVGVDVTGLGVGTHTAVLTMDNTDPLKPWDKDTLQIHVTIVAPQLTVATPSVLIGGTSGLDLATSPLQFSVNTGTRAHPWTVTLTGDWLSADAEDGTVSAAQQQVALDADRFAVGAGVYAGSVKVDVNVDGHALTQTVPVTFNREVEKLLVTADGVAFAQLPSRELLTRDVRVLSTLDRTDVPWTATADQDWLAVTASGETGDALTLAADPMLLAADMLHEATVTVTSSAPDVTNTETIRVGLWIGSADATTVTVPGRILKAVMDPVAPWVYTLEANSNVIAVYHTYTGALVRSLPSAATITTGLAISSDGRTLFVHEFPNRPTTGETPAKAYAMRASDGELLRDYDFTVFGYSYDLGYGRPDTRPMLYPMATSRAIDVASGEVFGLNSSGGTHLTVTADNRTVYRQTESVFVKRESVRHSTLGGDAVHVPAQQATVSMGSGDSAVSPDGSRLYGTGMFFGGDPIAFRVYDPLNATLLDPIPTVPFPNNLEVSWNGLAAAGASATHELTDLWFYDAAGTLLGSDSCTGVAESNLVGNSVRFSGDGLRYLCSAEPSSSDTPRTTNIRDVPVP